MMVIEWVELIGNSLSITKFALHFLGSTDWFGVPTSVFRDSGHHDWALLNARITPYKTHHKLCSFFSLNAKWRCCSGSFVGLSHKNRRFVLLRKRAAKSLLTNQNNACVPLLTNQSKASESEARATTPAMCGRISFAMFSLRTLFEKFGEVRAKDVTL